MDLTPILRIMAATAMAFPVGLDREIRGKPAGIRTHLLLAASTASLAWLSVHLAEGDPSADPTRIMSYVVAGIGFLGAGVIVGVRGRVYGLTTATTAFAVMAIGLLNGSGQHLTAAALTATVLLALGPMDWLKHHTYGRIVSYETAIHVLVPDTAHLQGVMDLLDEGDLGLRALHVRPVGAGVVLQVTVRGTTTEVTALRDRLTGHHGTAGTAVETGSGAPDGD